MGFSTADAKAFMAGIVLLIVALIFFVRLLPYAWGYIQSGEATVNGTTYVLTDVPGGSLIETLVVFLIAMMGGVALVLKVFDLI